MPAPRKHTYPSEGSNLEDEKATEEEKIAMSMNLGGLDEQEPRDEREEMLLCKIKANDLEIELGEVQERLKDMTQ